MRDSLERPHPLVRRALTIVNPRAGSVGAGATDRILAQLGEHGVGGRVIESETPDALEADLAAAGREGMDAAIVLGGDGTARTAAQLSGADGVPLILLPGGTMNVLPHALYGAEPWPQALDIALSKGRVQDLPGARANGELFFVAGVFGSPALAATARESMRAGRLLEAFARMRRAFRRAFGRRLRAGVGNGPLRRVEAVAIMAPLMAKTPGFDRMEAAFLDPAGAFSAFRLGLGALTGGWRHDPAAQFALAVSADIHSRGGTPAILDGEPTSLGPHVRVEVVPKAARVIAPPLTAQTAP